MIYQNACQLIGNTPLLHLSNIEKKLNLNVTLLAKVEYFNPTGSVKDRVALSMIETAEQKGLISPSRTVVIEPTSGNTGIGLASVCASKGYKCILVMPENMSKERIKLIKAYGADVVLSPKEKGMQGAVDTANDLTKKYESSFIPSQFDNPSNPEIHYKTTGPEIYKSSGKKVDIFLAGIGTGGTISGVGKYLKEQNRNIKIIGIEPADSPLLTKGKAGPHKIQGIGANFVPKTLDRNYIDEILTTSTEEAYEYARMLGKYEGILVGISSGGALAQAVKVAKRNENNGKTIVVLLPDSGDRYLSTDLFE
jgi:cysteine synthase A